MCENSEVKQNSEEPRATVPHSQGIPGYDYSPRTAEDRVRWGAEAERRGHAYQIFVDGYQHNKPKEGTLYVAQSNDEAKERGYCIAIVDCGRMDGISLMEPLSDYATHAFIIRHLKTGRIIWNYTPPTPEEVEAGKYTSCRKLLGLEWMFDRQS